MNQRPGRQDNGSFPNSIGKRKKNFKNEDMLRDMWGNIKCRTFLIIERDRVLFEEIIAEPF